MKKSKLSLGLAFIVSLLALASCGENGKGDSDELWICAYDGGYGSTWIENAASDFEEKTGTKVHFDLDKAYWENTNFLQTGCGIVTLKKGESMYTQSGGMAYQTEGIEMNTNARGGIMKSLGRAFAGESIFMANYRATKDDAVVAFATTVPGSIVALDLSQIPQGITLQKGAFLCAEQNVETKVAFTKRFSAGLFGGEGFILQKGFRMRPNFIVRKTAKHIAIQL